MSMERNIVPLMLEGFDFDSPKIASQLTGKLASLRHYNGLPVYVAYFTEAMDRLRERYLSVSLDAVLHRRRHLHKKQQKTSRPRLARLQRFRKEK